MEFALKCFWPEHNYQEVISYSGNDALSTISFWHPRKEFDCLRRGYYFHTHTPLQPPASGNVIRWLVCLLRKVINQVLSFVHPRRLHLIRPASRTSGLTTWGSEAHVLAMRPSCNQPCFPSDWTKEGKKNQRKALSTVATFQSEHEVSPTNPEGQIV